MNIIFIIDVVERTFTHVFSSADVKGTPFFDLNIMNKPLLIVVLTIAFSHVLMERIEKKTRIFS